MQPVKLRENVVFTEEEYEDLFYGGRDNKASLMKLKCVLIKKGFKEEEVTRARYCDIENFIFNSIVREKVLYFTSFANEKGVSAKLFYIYMNLVNGLDLFMKTIPNESTQKILNDNKDLSYDLQNFRDNLTYVQYEISNKLWPNIEKYRFMSSGY